VFNYIIILLIILNLILEICVILNFFLELEIALLLFEINDHFGIEKTDEVVERLVIYYENSETNNSYFRYIKIYK